ncbi:hypothetical protein Tco_0743251 [Tanacetum coccineum]
MKAQELKTKTSAQTLIYKIFLQRYQVYQGRLLASFQDDAKYEHVGQDTRSQVNLANTSESDSDYDLPLCDGISPINVYDEKAVTFSNPLFDSNDDFTSSDDESLSDEDVPEDNFKIYSNPLFEFDDEYISNDVNPLFDEVLEDIECKDSYDSNLDESTFIVTPLFDSNEDECFTPSDDVELLLHHDSSTPMINNEWKKILYDDPIDDLIFNPGGDIDEIDAFLDIDISTDIEDGYHDSEGDILDLESLLSNDTILSLPPEVFLDHDLRSLSSLIYKKKTKKIHDSKIKNRVFNVEIPSGESKVDIDVLSVLWGNRLPIPDGSLPLSR